MACDHYWVPDPHPHSTYLRCPRCRGKTTMRTLCILDGSTPPPDEPKDHPDEESC